MSSTASMLVLAFGTLISHGFGLALVPAMLPRINADLGSGYGLLGLAIAVGLLTYSLGALASGWVLDHIPTRTVLVGSFVTTSLGLLVAAAADSTVVLTVAVVMISVTAPISWNATIHVASVTVAARSRTAVMAGASSGAALGVLINGVLVQTSSTLHSWRISFVIAASLALIPIIGSALLYREPIERPQGDGGMSGRRGDYRKALVRRPGRVVFAAGLVAGAAGFPFSVFLTATAVDEMMVSALGAASLWWLIGIVGIVAGPVFGRFGDRTTPLTALFLGAAAYAAGLGVLVAAWGFVGLAIAAVGYGLMNYPIWGLAGAIANQHFEKQTAVRSVSLGLVAASLGGAIANAATGAWIDATGSSRLPVALMFVMVASLVAWYTALLRSGGVANR